MLITTFKRLIVVPIIASAALAFLLALTAFPVAHSSPAATTRYVALDGVCGGQAPCYTSIQSAVDAATTDDTILIASGTYTGVLVRPQKDVTDTGTVKQIVYISKTINLRGGYTTTNWITAQPHTQITTLDAEYQGRVIYITGKITPTIEGLYLLYGSGTGQGGGRFNADAAGGVYVISATATLSNNVILSSTAQNGGGLFFYESPSLVVNNLLRGNSANFGGGASAFSFYFGGLTFRDNRLQENQASGPGGGLSFPYANIRVTIDGNSILSNTASGGGGGGIYIQQSSQLIISNNLIEANQSFSGGGLSAVSVSTLVITGNVIANNYATGGDGGGVYLSSSPAQVLGNQLVGNHTTLNGGGLFAGAGTVNLIGNTFTDNEAQNGGGLAASGAYVLTLLDNSIISNTASNSGGGIYAVYSGQLKLDRIQILSNTAQTGNGGGVYLQQNASAITATIVRGNSANFSGGGIAMIQTSPALINTVVADNSSQEGAGLYINNSFGSTPIIRHATIARNTGGSGIYAYHSSGGGSVNLVNVIVASHTLGISSTTGAGVTLDGVLWSGNGLTYSGDGILDVTHEYTGSPAFDLDGYHILSISAAIDKGVSTGVKVDIDGEKRPMAFSPDLGADEAVLYKVALPIVLKNF